MCSWCYGIAPEITSVEDHYGGELTYELVLGGLRPFNTETMSELKDFLAHHWEEVHKKSGQEFNYDILNNSEIMYDTEPPSRATVVVRKMAPEKELLFFKKTQTLFYFENKNMHLAESYTSILTELGIDYTLFVELFDSPDIKNEVKRDFQKSQQMGVRGFPTLILSTSESLHLIANGYSKADTIIERIDTILLN